MVQQQLVNQFCGNYRKIMEIESVQEQDVAQPVVEAAIEAPEMSKKQKKRIEKMKQYMESKKKIKAYKRAKRKANRQLAKEQGKPLNTGPSRKAFKKNKVDIESAQYSVAIDLSFDDLMTDKNLVSCASQLQRIYTANRRAKTPLPVYFTSLKPDSRMQKMLSQHEGSQNWDIIRSEKSFLELFDRNKIIYLSSEAEESLNKLKVGACYVIGGLVDHNSQKGLTYELAKKENIRTAKLPIREHVQLLTRSVLTINQCFEMLIQVADGKSWAEACKETIPQRKLKKLKESSSSDTQ